MKLIYIYVGFVLLIGCNFSKDEAVDNTANQEVETISKYIYNINIDSLYVLSETVRNGESVGQILNSYKSRNP